MREDEVKLFIISKVDFFYLPLFRRFIDIKTFRYGVCGGANLVLDAILYFLFYHYLFLKENIELLNFTISPEIASFLLSFSITFFTGFWLTKHISFENKGDNNRQQQFKYLLVVAINIATKYYGLKLLTLVVGIFPSIANVIMSAVTVIISFTLQRKFTFK